MKLLQHPYRKSWGRTGSPSLLQPDEVPEEQREVLCPRLHTLPLKSGTAAQIPTSQPKSGARQLQPAAQVLRPVLWTLRVSRPEWLWKVGALYNPQTEDWGSVLKSGKHT